MPKSVLPPLLPGLLPCYDNKRNTAIMGCSTARHKAQLYSVLITFVRPAGIAIDTLIIHRPANRVSAVFAPLIPGGLALSDHFRSGRSGRRAGRWPRLVPWAT